MRRVRGTALWAVALTALAMAFVDAPAGGAANSKVTVGIGYDPFGASPFFRGIVRSGRASCVANRPVRVFRQQNGRHRVLFGSDRSESGGSWRVPLAARMRIGGYLAVVRAKPGCGKAFSDPIAVGQKGPGG